MTQRTKYAFPITNDAATNGDCGMTLRDYFAGQAMLGMIVDTEQNGDDTAKTAYAFADAMLEARK